MNAKGSPIPYILLGHGSESQVGFEERRRLPPGYTLVTLAECGAVTTIHEVAAFLNTFSDPAAKEMLENPRDHKRDIEAILQQPIHVYSEGMYYPSMTLQLFADWEVKGKVRRAVKSGVYPFPTDATAWMLDPSANTWENRLFGNYTVSGMYNPVLEEDAVDFAGRFYSGSLFPTEGEVQDALTATKRNMGKYSKAMQFPLDAVFQRGGPGIYYYVICRSPHESDFAEYVDAYITDVPTGFEEAKNVIPYIPTLLPKMEKMAEDRRKNIARKRAALATQKGVPDSEFVPSKANRYAIEGWNTEAVLGAPNKYRKLYANTMRIRRASMNQQGLNAGKKTRKTRRSRQRQRKQKTRRTRGQ